MKKVIIIILIIALLGIGIYFLVPLLANSNQSTNIKNIDVIKENPNSASAPIQKIVIPENTGNNEPQISENGSLVLDLSGSN